MLMAFGMVGDPVEAWRIQQWKDESGDRNALPEGWRYLGSGVQRSVYLSPTGVAYKIGSGNDTEYECATTLQDKLRASSARTVRATSILYFPKVHLFNNGVLAMEYIEGERPDDDSYEFSEAEDMADSLGISYDFHSGNVIEMADGRFAIIDYGYETASEDYL